MGLISPAVWALPFGSEWPCFLRPVANCPSVPAVLPARHRLRSFDQPGHATATKISPRPYRGFPWTFALSEVEVGPTMPWVHHWSWRVRMTPHGRSNTMGQVPFGSCVWMGGRFSHGRPSRISGDQSCRCYVFQPHGQKHWSLRWGPAYSGQEWILLHTQQAEAGRQGPRHQMPILRGRGWSRTQDLALPQGSRECIQKQPGLHQTSWMDGQAILHAPLQKGKLSLCLAMVAAGPQPSHNWGSPVGDWVSLIFVRTFSARSHLVGFQVDCEARFWPR